MSSLTNFLKEGEGERKQSGLHIAYQDQAGVWTIGWGHTGPDVRRGQKITDTRAEELLEKDSKFAQDAYDRLVTVDLPQNQRDAVTSLIFNVGTGAFAKSKALSHLNNAEYKKFQYEAFDKFQGFTKITGAGGNKIINKGLINRRASEQSLFGKGLDAAPPPVDFKGPYAPISPSGQRLADRGEEFVEHPFLKSQVNLNPITRLPQARPDDVPFFDALHAGVVLNNPISGFVDQGFQFKPTFPNDPNYEITTDPNLEGEDYSRYTKSMSAQESVYLKGEIERNAIYQELSSHRGGGWGTLIGVLGNPVIMGPALATAGSSMAIAAATDISAEILSEAILHSQQPLRTKVETATNLALVGVVDGALWRLSATSEKRALLRKIRKATLDLANDSKPHFRYVGVTESGKIKVAPAKRADEIVRDMDGKPLEDQAELTVSDVGEDVVTGYVPGMRFSPAGDVIAHSYSATAKKAVQLLVDVPYRFVKSILKGEAVPTSAENRIKQAQGDFSTMTETFAEKFKAYQKSGGEMTVEDFLLEVHRSMESGMKHADPNVASVTKVFRQFDESYRAADETAGIATLKGRRKGGHVQRIYSHSKITTARAGLKTVIARHLAKLGDAGSGNVLVRMADGEYDVLSKEAAEQAKKEDSKLTIFTNDNLFDEVKMGDITDDIINRIVGVRTDDIDPDLIVFAPGSSKTRTLGFIPTKELEPWLETNALSVMSVTSRQHYRAAAMRQAFPDDPSMIKTLEKVAEEYDALKNATTDPKELKALDRRLNTDLNKLKALRDSIMGTYGIPKDITSAVVRFARLARIGTLMGYGANIASTSLTDLLTPAIRHGLAPFMHGVKLLFKGAVKKEFLQQIRAMGIATESVTNNKAALLANMVEITKGEQKALKVFGKYTGLDWVTDTSQAYNAMSHSLMFKKWFDGFGRLSDAKKLRLLDVGLDAKTIKTIKGQWDQYGEIVDGVRLPSAHLWPDQNAADIFTNAIRKETFMTTLVPGKGDIPLWLQTEPGKFFGMFQSFVAGAHQKLLIAGFQRSDADFYMGVIVAAIGGGLVQAGKDLARGRDPSTREPIEYIIRSLDKSGLLGWFGLPMQSIGALARGEAPEFIWRNMSDSAFNPPALDWGMTFGIPALGAIQGELPTEEETYRMGKAIPMLNSFHLLDMTEQLLSEDK